MKTKLICICSTLLCFSSFSYAQNQVVVIPLGGITTPSTPAPVAKTGQQISYVVGDDGSLQKGIALPSPRFTNNNNGTVTDNLTGLIWLTNANCIQTDNAAFDNDIIVGDGRVTWAHALDFIAGVNAGTYSCGDTSNGGANQIDWRLPNRFEMESLFHLNFFNPMLSNAAGTAQWSNGDVFTGVATSNFYWSSTTTPGSTSDAFALDFWIGDVTSRSKTTGYFVWPVRGEQ
ncbi:MAG: DUF1566 domain-containing protein [Proteobacteria bacterium]|nr:DUF1566 domain-containing protein [Pseudomonadota bacterium]MBU1057759.1 DUF1566 domain-containing protein [Pseudomonadota bacterium]